MQRADAVIIGAGVVGCSIAWALTKRGYRTQSVDRLPAAGYGSTSHSSAIVRPLYSHVTSCAVAHESRALWRQWREVLALPADRVCAEYNECGVLALLVDGEEDAFDAHIAAMETVGVPYERLSASALQKLYPDISLHSYGPPKRSDDPGFALSTGRRIAGALAVAAAGYVSDPQLAARNLQQAAAAQGAEFRFNAAVRKITAAPQVTGVKMDDGSTIAAPIVINAAGPHSAAINALAGVADTFPIPTRALRHEVAYLRADAPHFKHSERVFIDLDCGTYHRRDGSDLLIGSADPACDPADVVDPDDYQTGFTDQWLLQTQRTAQRFPELGISNQARGTVGLYDVSPDWIPVYDRTDVPGYYVAIGTSGNQFKNAPLIGEIMAQIIETDAQGDHDQDPAQLALPHCHRTVNLAFYSRRRALQSTHSVIA